MGESGREPVACCAQRALSLAARWLREAPPTPAMRTAPAGTSPVSDPRPERAMRVVSWLICRADMKRVAPKKPKSSPINVFMFAGYSIPGMSANGRERQPYPSVTKTQKRSSAPSSSLSNVGRSFMLEAGVVQRASAHAGRPLAVPKRIAKWDCRPAIFDRQGGNPAQLSIRLRPTGDATHRHLIVPRHQREHRVSVVKPVCIA